jgi:hypothetical protein
VAKILHGVLEPQQRTLVAVGLLGLLHAAIGALRGSLGFFGRHALAFEIICEQSQVGRNFARKLRFGVMAVEEVPESRKKSSQAQHGYSSVASSFSTKPAICRQRAVSSSSAFNPAFVMV